MATILLTDQNFAAKVLQGEKPILVDFYADWCGPCKMAEPILEQLAKDYQDKAEIGKIDVDKYPQIAAKYQVMSIPTTILFKSGQELNRQVGFGGRAPFEELLKKAL